MIKIRPKINMIVCSFALGYRINLRRVATWIGGEYDPRRFRGLSWQDKREGAAIILYGNGKGIASGFRSYQAAKTTLKELLSYLRIDSSKISLNIVNIQASARIHRKIDLYKLASAIGASYLPGIFGNAQYRIADPKVTVVISGKGGLSFLGAKSKEELIMAAKHLEKLFKKHEKNIFI